MKHLCAYMLVLLCFACTSNHVPLPSEYISNRIIMEFADKMIARGLNPLGIGGGLDHEQGKQRLFSITFSTFEELQDIQDGRKLLVEILEEFIGFINEREDVKDYLSIIPISIENVRVSLVCKDAKPNAIVNVANYGSYLCYRINSEQQGKVIWKKIHEETFEEAQKKVLEQ